MERDSLLKIYYLKSVDSTQLYLKKQLQNKVYSPPCVVYTYHQTNGIGSRDNSWKGFEGNLFLSFAIHKDMLPRDLKIESASIYFAYLLKETLAEFGSQVWLKWPNDFYLKEKKLGGMITHVVENNFVCGVGLNLQSAPENFAKLDIRIDGEKLLENYLQKIEKKILWKQVFSKYKLEFHKNKSFKTHISGAKISLSDALLQEDGSVMINGEKVYSLR